MSSPIKPLGIKAYGSIPHLPGSRRGIGDKGLSVEQARICIEKTRDAEDVIVVQEKLDGSNVAVAKVDGKIVPLIRAGYIAWQSHFRQHHYFAWWVQQQEARFDALLNEGERVSGEWLAQAHGTRYDLKHEPFVAFDLFSEGRRVLYETFLKRAQSIELITPQTIHIGGAISIENAVRILDEKGSRHGALDMIEGAVWRVERRGGVEFLGKYVRPEKVDGLYLSENSTPIWHWKPEKWDESIDLSHTKE